ncbi:hypothetical protein [Kitasatospora sp. NPDC048538]|uniref:hypothetical protein n=1 Tax=unclassified Kitasatospora TaxID=2633591 RepID=UPI0033C085B5
MAAATPPRRRRVAVPAAALAALAVLVALAVLAAGRVTPGGLHDDGAAAPVTPPPRPQPLWPDLAASPPPIAPADGADPATQAPPQPVPDVTVPGRDITAVDVRAVLAKDPALGPEERHALDSCPGCEVRAPEFRDLTGDGRPELVAAVATTGPVVLHVYTLAEDRLLPVLRAELVRGFSAATVGSDLWLYEPTTVFLRTSSHYGWNGTRLALLERKIEGIGPVPGPTTDGGNGTGRPAAGSGAEPAPAPAPAVTPSSGRGQAPSRPKSTAPDVAPPTATPSPLAGAAPATARPAPVPSEAKR